MLVLTRRVDERFFIGDDIVITVIAVKGESTVKIGIEAPRHIQVEREELRQAPLKNYMEKKS